MSQYQSFFISASGEKNERQKIDWRASLATDEQSELFDKLKDFAEELFSEYQKICSKFFTQCKQKSSDNTRQNDCKSPCCTSQ